MKYLKDKWYTINKLELKDCKFKSNIEDIIYCPSTHHICDLCFEFDTGIITEEQFLAMFFNETGVDLLVSSNE